jgi:hypothetical protein
MKEFIEKLIAILDEEFECYPMVEISERIRQLAEEYKDNVMINRQYCWQTCGATEHCKECNRLCNGSIDYYENYI